MVTYGDILSHIRKRLTKLACNHMMEKVQVGYVVGSKGLSRLEKPLNSML